LDKIEFHTPSFHKERITLFADILLPVPIANYFTYRVPFELNDKISIGCRVIVQFGKKRILTGVVAQLHENPPQVYQAKYLLDILDEAPLVNGKQLKLFQWISDYYMATRGEVLNVAMPSGLKLSSESRIQLNPQMDLETSEEAYSEKEFAVLRVLMKKQMMTYSEVARVLQTKTYVNVIKSLLAKDAILIFEEVKEKYTPKRESGIRLTSHWNDKKHLEVLLAELDKKPKQQEVLLGYLRYVPVFRDKLLNTKGLKKSTLLESGVSESSLNTLVKNNVFEQFYTIIPRFELSSLSSEYSFELSPEQVRVKASISQEFEKKQTVLLHGITGSGKTEIYIELMREVLSQGEQVLYLLPEIALTAQIVSRLQKVFGDKMGVYHSRFSDNERVEIWKGLLSRRYEIIVGVRSSVFLPFENLGLIIVDEEHEFSYKQYDPAPRYNARDVAQILASFHNAKVLMGSATPSMESAYLAREGKYGLVSLDVRYGEAVLPKIQFADLLRERKERTLKGDFTSMLIEKLTNTLGRNEQAIVFQNRRGYAPYITCEACGWTPKCNSCAVSLTYHMHINQLQCHYCGHHERMPVTCPACGTATLKAMGFGTEKLEDDLKVLFPHARIQRMDLDTTRKKYSYQTIISEFEKGDIDILVGTQMVSKGLNFDGVTLVGIFDIDRMLHFPDFRSAERAFQLAVQVSGRSGRKDKPGEVIIQTAGVNRPALLLIASQNYNAFYENEIEERRKYKYPPFYRLIKIILKHSDKDILTSASTKLANSLKQALKNVDIYGPHEPLISKIRDLYLMEIIIKIPRSSNVLDSTKNIIQHYGNHIRQEKEFRQVMVLYDVDPV